MATFDHPNVLTLIGVCLDGGPAPYIVMPFMFNGSLHSHLKKERSKLVVTPDQEMDIDTVSYSYCQKFESSSIIIIIIQKGFIKAD